MMTAPLRRRKTLPLPAVPDDFPRNHGGGRMRRGLMKKVSRFLAALAVPLALAGTAAFAAGPALAGPVYADTSVTVLNGPVHTVDPITLTPTSIAVSAFGNASATETVQLADATAGVTWGLSASSADGYGLAIDSTGKLTITNPAVIPAAPASIPTVQVTATDAAGAMAVATLTGMESGTNIVFSVSDDNVTSLHGTDQNGPGNILFTAVSVPAATSADTFTAGNLPGGTAMTGDVLAAAGAVPGWYKSVTVKATDAAGASAVEDIAIRVNGSPVRPDVPRLSGGHAMFVTGTRENVYFIQSGAASCDHFVIVGPGGINGHQGWVRAHLGLNAAVYWGLEYHHGYTVYYTPVVTSDPNSCAGAPTTPIPGSHWGYVYFVS